jgi:23S rRNA (pseudouridine1915-N3)-methyltransferase
MYGNMRISFINIGKTQETFLKEGLAYYENRIRHYAPFELVTLNPPRLGRTTPEPVQKEAEGKILLSALAQVDYPVLLDERGKAMTSQGFATFLQQAMNRGTRCLGFVTGGPYGFSPEVYDAVPERISLSGMTFSHQLVRLVFLEQLYRGFTIIRGEPYHHA